MNLGLINHRESLRQYFSFLCFFREQINECCLRENVNLENEVVLMSKVSSNRIQNRQSSIVELDLAVLSAVSGGGRDPDDLSTQGQDPTAA